MKHSTVRHPSWTVVFDPIRDNRNTNCLPRTGAGLVFALRKSSNRSPVQCARPNRIFMNIFPPRLASLMALELTSLPEMHPPVAFLGAYGTSAYVRLKLDPRPQPPEAIHRPVSVNWLARPGDQAAQKREKVIGLTRKAQNHPTTSSPNRSITCCQTLPRRRLPSRRSRRLRLSRYGDFTSARAASLSRLL